MMFYIIAATACKTAPASRESASGKSASAEPPATNAAGTLEQSILNEVNQYRKEKGLAPLRANSIIATEASLHSQAMARKKVAFGHGGFGGRVKRISARLGGIVGSAENVALGKLSAAEVVQRWIKSPPHRKNLEGPYNLTGIGVSRDAAGVFFYTQVFIRN